MASGERGVITAIRSFALFDARCLYNEAGFNASRALNVGWEEKQKATLILIDSNQVLVAALQLVLEEHGESHLR